MSFAGGRTPFRPLQQAKHPDAVKMQQQSSRLHDSPMDFDYDAPSRQRQATSSTWLNAPAHEEHGMQRDDVGSAKRSMDDVRSADDAFVFGAEAIASTSKNSSSGAFLFHQPLSPTIAGPDVEMSGETPPSSKRSDAGVHDGDERTRQSSTSRRRLASQGAVMRVNRQREKSNGSGKKTQSQSRRRKPSLTPSARDDEDEHGDGDASGEWEDLGVADGKQRVSRSLRKRVGDTLNIQYFFNHGVEQDGFAVQQHRSGHGAPALAWLDPEWCLGMAQFGFNSTLLLGIVWVLFNVVRTLQRDVSSKVREYELEYLAEIEACSQSYHLNRCGTAGAVPALASACASWQRCSARDPGSVGRARVAAETVAEIVNGFVDVVSWKSMLFTLLALIIVVGATNSFLSFFRIRSRQQHTHPATTTPYASARAALPPHDGYNLRPAHERQHLYGGGGGTAEESPMHDAYMRPSTWQASAPATPSSKRMCR